MTPTYLEAPQTTEGPEIDNPFVGSARPDPGALLRPERRRRDLARLRGFGEHQQRGAVPWTNTSNKELENHTHRIHVCHIW